MNLYPDSLKLVYLCFQVLFFYIFKFLDMFNYYWFFIINLSCVFLCFFFSYVEKFLGLQVKGLV